MICSSLLTVVLPTRKAAMVLVLPVPGGLSMVESGYSSVRTIASCCHLPSLFHNGNVPSGISDKGG